MIKIDASLCTGCGRCVQDCLAKKISLENGAATVREDCILCGHCVAVCPRGAVQIPEYDMEDVEEYQEGLFRVDPAALLRSIKFRRSIRHYKPVPVEREKLAALLQAGRYTATGSNLQDCSFSFVQEELDHLKEQVWDFIENLPEEKKETYSRYLEFNRRRKADPNDDYLFRDAPAVLFVAGRELESGMAAQNMELLAYAEGLGAMYDGFLARIADANEPLKKWLELEGKTIQACLLLGYPAVSYRRTAPRKAADVSWR